MIDPVMLNQDPVLRAKILPLFHFRPSIEMDRPLGVGTTFRIDPWGNCATAFHVIEHLLEIQNGAIEVTDEVRLVALELEGIIFGSPPIPKDAWRPLNEIYSIMSVLTPPVISERKSVKNVSELARLNFSRSHDKTPMPFLPISLQKTIPKVGDVVTAYGFAGLDLDRKGQGEGRPFSQYLYEASGKVLEVIQADGNSSRPWPRIRVNRHWPSGMSGGPVMDVNGEVIGIVSTSFQNFEESTATFFAGWNLSADTFPTIDPVNPGCFLGHAVIDEKDDVIQFREKLHEINTNIIATNCKILKVSFNPESGGWMSF